MPKFQDEQEAGRFAHRQLVQIRRRMGLSDIEQFSGHYDDLDAEERGFFRSMAKVFQDIEIDARRKDPVVNKRGQRPTAVIPEGVKVVQRPPIGLRKQYRATKAAQAASAASQLPEGTEPPPPPVQHPAATEVPSPAYVAEPEPPKQAKGQKKRG